ncbi:amidohydrolase family protein [Cellulosilyticum sp. I15G10I2]|uniref:amidohydrolase family protein n=1 Tax=Cellulosilyticum sp. I15G10I2 TaxID=1892843 RepID=UPI0009F61227|nr:amidohydrolase family protein [Cellulosilyticum sp. I15G10I2]
MIKALIHANLFDYENYREDYYVLFNHQIVEVGPMACFKGADEVFDCKHQMVLPGFVNGHSHIYSAFARGWNTPCDAKNFTEFLEQMWWKLDSALDEEAVYYSGLVSGIECLKNGVTTIVDHHASGRHIKGSLNTLKKSICDEAGLRGIFCFETSDRFNLQQCIEENLEFAAQHQSAVATGIFGMHANMTLSNLSLETIQRQIGDMPIHIHVGESTDDGIYTQKVSGQSVVERLDHFGLLKKNSILSHCIYISEKDKDLLAQKEIYAAVNPTSNMNNGVGLPDVKGLMQRGIKCLIGNDGLGFNLTRDMQNLMYTMHLKYQSAQCFGLQEVTEIIKNNYDYAGKLLGCQLGRFEKGYEADFMEVFYNPPTPMDKSNMLGHFFYGILDRFTPNKVWAQGEVRVAEGKVKIDEAIIYKEARHVADKVWHACKES